MDSLLSGSGDFDQLGALLDDGLLLVDGESRRIDQVNQAAVRYLGENLVGKKLNKVLAADNIKGEVAACLSGDTPVEFASKGKRDNFRQFRVRLRPIAGGKVAVLVMDMNLQRNLDKVRRDFVANVSHELRSPLTSLIGFIETMGRSEEVDGPTRRRFLAIMDEEARRMSRLIDDLMSLSRVETEEHIAPTARIAIKDVVQSVVGSMSNRAAMDNRSVLFTDNRGAGDDAPMVMAETDEIMEVFHNLLDNAIKYGRPGTDIRVELDAPNERYLRFDVVNEGDAIPKKHIPRLTERFYRVDKGRSREMGGTGLGLAIVKHIVNRHRGHLAVRSKKGETVFSVTLPIAGQHEPQADGVSDETLV